MYTDIGIEIGEIYSCISKSIQAGNFFSMSKGNISYLEYVGSRNAGREVWVSFLLQFLHFNNTF